MIIGVVSYDGAGKDTFAEYLVKKGYKHFSCSDEIREELKKRGMEENRDNLTNLGNEMRQKQGNDILAKKIFEKMNDVKKENYVISSIRNPAEVIFLKTVPNFTLIRVDCLPEIRYERLKKRSRAGDYNNVEEFVAGEKREESKDASKQQLHKVCEMADTAIDNSGELEEFYKKIDSYLS